jgi:hypothetical protein
MFYSEGDGLAFLVALGDGLLGENVIVVKLGCWEYDRFGCSFTLNLLQQQNKSSVPYRQYKVQVHVSQLKST